MTSRCLREVIAYSISRFSASSSLARARFSMRDT